jgi:hypothetical protein
MNKHPRHLFAFCRLITNTWAQECADMSEAEYAEFCIEKLLSLNAQMHEADRHAEDDIRQQTLSCAAWARADLHRQSVVKAKEAGTKTSRGNLP